MIQENQIEYEVIESPTLVQLIKLVQSYLDEGWKLEGGVAVSNSAFHQALSRVKIRSI